MDLKALLTKPPALPRAGRAPNNSTPKATRFRFSDEQLAKLARMAEARGTSMAQVVRDLVDGAA